MPQYDVESNSSKLNEKVENQFYIHITLLNNSFSDYVTLKNVESLLLDMDSRKMARHVKVPFGQYPEHSLTWCQPQCHWIGQFHWCL